mgnify:CR=1 FL=1
MSALTKKYKEFFVESKAGQDFIKSINDMIESKHEKAEDNPENARDYSQRAKGVREVKGFIDTLITESKKGGRGRTKS